jgi:hypothetical protein
MIKLKLWKWTLVIIWDHKRFHASRNPRRKDGVYKGGVTMNTDGEVKG